MWGSKLIPISLKLHKLHKLLKLHKLHKLHTMATLQRVNELDRQIRDPTNSGDPIAKIIALLILNRVRRSFTERPPTRVVPIQAPADPPVGPE